MVFLRSIALKRAPATSDFPFSLPVLRSLDIELGQVTFFVGENGSGKSTLMEALAAAMRLVAVGSHDVQNDPSLAPARTLAKELKLVYSRKANRGFFFRAEDIFGFTQKVIREQQTLKKMEEDFGRNLSGRGRDLAMGTARGQRYALTQKYGANPDARSHGEAFLHLFESRMIPNGLYLLDEPETPLSPLRQLAFISRLKQMVAQSCQFIIATHSPIILAFPDAKILSFDDPPIHEVGYETLEHVNLTRDFLNNPEAFLRRL